MKPTARANYALRATAFLAGVTATQLTTADTISKTERIPREFLETILRDLRLAGIVRARRGSDGGYALACPATEITVTQVLRAVGDGLLATPEFGREDGEDGTVVALWRAITGAMEDLLGRISVADIAAGLLPGGILDPADLPHR